MEALFAKRSIVSIKQRIVSINHPPAPSQDPVLQRRNKVKYKL
jgi:hypothetical protein